MSNWEVHLRAASSLILLLYGVSNGQAPNPNWLEDTFHPKDHQVHGVDNAALYFFTGAIIWFDTLACVSTGSNPYLSEFHNQLLSEKAPMSSSEIKGDSKIRLDSIMGCQNWVMVIISEIAWLRTWKDKELRNRTIEDIQQHLRWTENNIRGRLEYKNADIKAELDSLLEQYSGCPPHYSPKYGRLTTLIITHVFAQAALIYLHTVVGEELSTIDLQTPLRNTIAVMRILPDPQMVIGLVWPLCVAGCMASSPVDQEFFRGIATTGVADARSFGNLGKALEILEKSWELQRAERRPVDCTATIKQLGVCVLLV